jgi:hypothetical protein
MPNADPAGKLIRCSIRRRGAVAHLEVESVEGVTEETEAKHSEGDRQAAKDGDSRRRRGLTLTAGSLIGASNRPSRNSSLTSAKGPIATPSPSIAAWIAK